MPITNSTEAPCSVTYTVTSPDGFPLLFTVRGEHWPDLVEQMTEIEKYLLNENYKPQEKKSFAPSATSAPVGPPKATDRKCPQCGAPMVISPRSGKEYCSAKCWLKTAPFNAF